MIAIYTFDSYGRSYPGSTRNEDGTYSRPVTVVRDHGNGKSTIEWLGYDDHRHRSVVPTARLRPDDNQRPLAIRGL